MAISQNWGYEKYTQTQSPTNIVSDFSVLKVSTEWSNIPEIDLWLAPTV